jgi:hypothetical protein
MASELASSITKGNMWANTHNCIIHLKVATWYVKPLALAVIGIRWRWNQAHTQLQWLRALLYAKANRIYFFGFPIIPKRYSCITETKGEARHFDKRKHPQSGQYVFWNIFLSWMNSYDEDGSNGTVIQRKGVFCPHIIHPALWCSGMYLWLFSLES